MAATPRASRPITGLISDTGSRRITTSPLSGTGLELLLITEVEQSWVSIAVKPQVDLGATVG